MRREDIYTVDLARCLFQLRAVTAAEFGRVAALAGMKVEEQVGGVLEFANVFLDTEARIVVNPLAGAEYEKREDVRPWLRREFNGVATSLTEVLGSPSDTYCWGADAWMCSVWRAHGVVLGVEESFYDRSYGVPGIVIACVEYGDEALRRREGLTARLYPDPDRQPPRPINPKWRKLEAKGSPRAEEPKIGLGEMLRGRGDELRGSVLPAEDAERLRGLCPAWLIEVWREAPLTGVCFTLGENEDPTRIGVSMQWMTAAQVLSEATEAHPGIEARVAGFVPVGMCLAGSGDNYFASQAEDSPFVRIPQEAARGGRFDGRAVEIVAPSLSRFIRIARIEGPRL
jgi:hypothetical protein